MALLAVILNMILGLATLCGAILRETPLFWKNSGGFPIWLRETVQVFFYPGLALSLLLTAWVTMLLFKSAQRGNRLGAGFWLSWLLQIALILGALTIMSWNNISNLMEDAPLHQHGL